MFQLDYQFAVPDILFEEELKTHHDCCIDYGLCVLELGEIAVGYAIKFIEKYLKPSRNDLFALALAKHEECPLITGDRALRDVAENEEIEVHGTIWLIEQLALQKIIAMDAVKLAYSKMEKAQRRLPWDLVRKSIDRGVAP